MPMEGASPDDGGFTAVLSHLTEQVRREHQREVGELTWKINQLQLQLNHMMVQKECDGSDKISTGNSSTVDASFEAATPPSRPISPKAAVEVGAPGGSAKAAEPVFQLRHSSASSVCERPSASARAKEWITNSGRFSSEVLGSLQEDPIPDVRSCLACVEGLVRSNCFEFTFSALILLNAVFMAVEAQYWSMDVGNSISYHQLDATREWPGAEALFANLSWFFGPIFALEVVLKIIGLRTAFVYDAWNWIDLVVVLLSLMSNLGSAFPVNPQLIRLARLAKLARLMKLVKNIQGFDSLFLIMTSLKGSASILAWTSAMLFVVLLFNALLLNQILSEFYFTNASFPEAERREVYRYFGSMATSLFSMFELTLANWPPISRILYENVNDWFIVFAIIHKVTIGFAVVGVFNGVFMQETFKVAQQDEELQLRMARRAQQGYRRKMRRLLGAIADGAGTAEISREQLRKIFGTPAISAWLTSMEFSPPDVDMFFEMMDGGAGVLSADQVIECISRLRGGAKNVDLHTILHENRQFQRRVEERLLPARLDADPAQALAPVGQPSQNCDQPAARDEFCGGRSRWQARLPLAASCLQPLGF